MGAHGYLGTRDTRAVRKWSKVGRPKLVSLDRLEVLLAGLVQNESGAFQPAARQRAPTRP